MAFLGFLNAEFILRKMMLGVQRRWWFDLLVWQHEAFAKIASLATSVSPNPSVWQPGGGVLLSRDIHAGKGHPLAGARCTGDIAMVGDIPQCHHL